AWRSCRRGVADSGAAMKKGSRSGCLLAVTGSGPVGEGCSGLGAGAQVRKLVAELLDTTAEAVDALLRARVVRVRFAGGFQLDQRQFAAVVQLDRFLGLNRRADHELGTIGLVDKDHVA